MYSKKTVSISLAPNHINKYHLAIKKDKFESFVGKQMHPEFILVKERWQVKYCMVSLRHSKYI